MKNLILLLLFIACNFSHSQSDASTISVNPEVAEPCNPGLYPTTVNCTEDAPTPDSSIVILTEQCPSATITFISERQEGFCPKVITRKYRVTDEFNNSQTVNHTITVNDLQPPTASYPPTITIACSDEIPAIDINVVVDAQDNCAIPYVAFVSESRDGPDCPYTIIRIFRVTDYCGNYIHVTQTIEVLGDLGIDDNTLNHVTYTINSENILTINSIENLEKVTVYNLLGQELLVKPLPENNEPINLSELKSGVYIILVKAKNGKQKSIKTILR